MTALLRSLPLWTGWLTKGHLMVVWRENHTFHSGGLDHSVKKLSFPRQSSILFPFSGRALAWENSRHLATLPLVYPPNDVWETSAEIPYWWRVTTQFWVVLLIGWIKFTTRHDQSEALPRSGQWRVISMEFLRSFLRHHLVGKPVAASLNVGCFLRLEVHLRQLFWDLEVARVHVTLPLSISLITNLTVLVSSLAISMQQ